MAGELGQDPAYLAFMRAIGAQEADLRDTTDQQVGMLNRDLNRQLQPLYTSGEDTRRGISGNFETRGLYRSGEHEDALGRQRAEEAQAVSGLQGTAADQASSYQTDLLRQIADLRRRQAEAGLTTAQGLGADALY